MGIVEPRGSSLVTSCASCYTRQLVKHPEGIWRYSLALDAAGRKESLPLALGLHALVFPSRSASGLLLRSPSLGTTPPWNSISRCASGLCAALAPSFALWRRNSFLSPSLLVTLWRCQLWHCASALFHASLTLPPALHRHLSMHYAVALQSATPMHFFGLRRRSTLPYGGALRCATPPLQTTTPALPSALRWPYPTPSTGALFSTAKVFSFVLLWRYSLRSTLFGPVPRALFRTSLALFHAHCRRYLWHSAHESAGTRGRIPAQRGEEWGRSTKERAGNV